MKYQPKTQATIVKLLTILLLVSCLGQVASDLYLPSLPSIAKGFNIHMSLAQWTIAVYMFGFSISQLFYGPWSDSVGRRTPLIFGLSLNVVGGLICIFSVDIKVLLIGRLVQGLGAGAGTALVRSTLRDIFNKETLARYNSYLAISTVIILTLSPVIGGYIEHYSTWRYNFVFLTGLGLFVLIMYFFLIQETNQQRHADHFKMSGILFNMKTLLTHPVFLRFALCPFLTYGGILAWITAAPVVLQEKLGLSPVMFAWIYVIPGIGFAIGGFLNARWVERLGIDKMIYLGIWIQLLAGVLMLLLYEANYFNAWVIIIPVIIYMLGASLIFPNSSAGAFVPFAHIAGTAGAVFGCMQIAGGAISSSLLAIIHDENQQPMALAFIISALITLIIFTFLRGKESV